jgi:hypothetical protein
MEEITLQNIVDAAQGINTKRFLAELDAFIKTMDRMDPVEGLPDQRRDAFRSRQDEAYSNILRETGQILSHSTLAISFIINFRFQLNGRAKGIPSIDEKTSYYFRKIRKHQVELLLTIGNEISMIRDTLNHSRNMQQVFRENVPPVAQASLFMSVVRERIEARPTTLLKLNGTGRKIEQLNSTFSDIQTYEDTYHREIRQDTDANPISNAMEIYADLTAGALHDMEHRKRRLKADIKELTKGQKLMIKLATKGYSPFMKKGLETLVASHRERSLKFSAAIHEWRKSYYIEELS